ncbi:hypothetical protein F3Y22_tig00110847pilonHSYRG00180 [Hibiscus syriacus]|uniref:Integrase catalytic domain-containing protein n=1 Tax=Hibiscus syriacus TaxID=106335 RepID=A0A6A2ZLV3_HIBSY|nr:hypothetical protein F3Y22_tig00110847pilonHSYRG00180 [Hibiscus syriacus]
MEKDMVRAIDEWQVPTKVTELRSFLELANYYRSTFDEIKLAMISEPILVLSDHTKPFEVFTDASDVAIGGVLMQEGHPIAYESRKLNETERRYTVHEKEMTAVVHYLRTWRHYLFGSKFVVFTNNIANSYFLTQKKLSPKQARWQEFLAEFDLSLDHKPRKFEGLRKELMRECHDSKWAGHPGIHRTLVLIAEHYYWPHMGNDVEAYVKTYLVCRLHISDGFYSIMVVVDRFSKYGIFIPASKVCPAEEAARLFLKYVVKYWSVPKMIISDPDTRFTGRFWKELFKLMGSSLNFSISVHPKTDGQTERVNALVETYLRHYPLTLNAVVTGYQGPNPTTYQFAKEWQEQHELARACLHKVGKWTKKWVDRKRRDVNFEVGDLVLPKLSGILRNPYHKGLVRRYEGPFKVLKRVCTMAYKLELPSIIKAHHMFHLSLLKPYHQDEEELDRGKSHRAPVGVKVSYEREVEAIHAERAVHGVGKRPRHEYLVQWKGLPESEGSWETS